MIILDNLSINGYAMFLLLMSSIHFGYRNLLDGDYRTDGTFVQNVKC